MPKIQHLSQDIIAKIAAGEVIERPAYAVKELIENSIDAHADSIEIHIEEAGLKKITVIDNGEGMTREDVELCFLPHTTSKIQDESHPHGVKTLGFRGEALSSIASISHMTIRTRDANTLGGTMLTLRNGVMDTIRPIGSSIGTSVTVQTLFHSIPARKKFLKSTPTEFRHITEIVMHYCLSYPTIHFVLTHNGKTIINVPKSQPIKERISGILGANLSEQLFPVSYEDGYIKVKGFIGHPQQASKQQQKQYLFINKRSVSDRLLSLAVKESFGSLIPASNSPVFLLDITLPEEIVDVNVHPRKEQVTFVHPKDIFDAVKQAVTQTLNEHNITFRLSKFKEEHSARTGETTSFASDLLKKTVLSSTSHVPLKISGKTPLSQIDATFITHVTNDGITIFDQHALHERMLFEEFSKAFSDEKKKGKQYTLTTPLSLTLSVAEKQLIDEYIELFEKIGFTLEHFQGTTFVIRTVPSVFKGRKVEKIVRDMLDDLSQVGSVRSIDIRTQRMLAFLSCRAAVKAGDVLAQQQMKDLIKGFTDVPHNSTCPHGRPTRFEITTQELLKMFKRS